MKVVVGSKNPVKLAAVQESFEKVFPDTEITFQTYDASSGVPDQPFGTTETKLGAYNRAQDCKHHCSEADFWVGLEGGLERDSEDCWASAWMCICGPEGRVSYGMTGAFLLPPKVSQLINDGIELGHATDIVFNETNSKHQGGTVGILTNSLINRNTFYQEALIFALIPFIKPELY